MASPISNKELIENLTKDFRDSCVSMTDNEDVSKPTANPESRSQNDDDCTDEKTFTEPDLDEDDTSKHNKPEDGDDIEFVDEIGLEERDSLLSIEEKEVCDSVMRHKSQNLSARNIYFILFSGNFKRSTETEK